MSYSEVQVSLPHRPVGMPEVYQVKNHPLLEGIAHVGNVYVGYMGTDKWSVKDRLDLEKALKCPKGDVAEWVTQGLLPLTWGDYFYVRDPDVSKDAKDDVLAIMVTGRPHHESNPGVLRNFDKATQAMLGTRDTRTSTAFERTRCACKIQKKHCYAIGAAIQLSRRVVAPSASLDQNRKKIRIYQSMVRDLVNATSDMLLDVQAALPDICQKAFAANSELTGQPGVGKKGVYGTSSIQVNISAASLSASDNRLASQLGDFGCEHYDGRDSPDHLTTMFANPDIPNDYNPGAFHILQLGAFAVLRKYTGITFSGQRRHIGTAPTPPSNNPAAIDAAAYRFNVVCYPKDAAVDGLSTFSLASLPAKKQTRKSLAPTEVSVMKEGEVPYAEEHDEKLAIMQGAGVEVEITGNNKDTPKLSAGQSRDDEDHEDGSEGEDDEGDWFSEEDWDGDEESNGRVEGYEWDGDVHGGLDGPSDGEEGDGLWDCDRYGDGDVGGALGTVGVTDEETKGEKKRGIPPGFDPEPLYITPEMINMSDETFVPHTSNRATFARSGHVIMNRESHVAFIGRSLHQLNSYVWRQLPLEYSLSIDVKKMLESVSYKDEDGNRVHLSDWPSAPGVHTTSTERQKNKEIWSAYQKKGRRFIPRIASRAFNYNEKRRSKDEGRDNDNEDEDEDEGEGEDEGGENEDEDDDAHAERPGRNPTEDVETDVDTEEVLIERALLGPCARPLEPTPLQCSTTHGAYRLINPLENLPGTSHSSPGTPGPSSSTRDDMDTTSASHHTTMITGKRGGPAAANSPQAPNKRPRLNVAVLPTSSGAHAGSSWFPFLQNLTAQVLRDEAEELYRDLDRVLQGSALEQVHPFNWQELVSEYRDIPQDPTSYLAPGRIRHIQVQLRAHIVTSAIQAIWTRRERFLVLLSSVHVWYWLDVVIKDRIEAIFRTGCPEATPGQHQDDWLLTLVALIKHGLIIRSDPIELDPYTHYSLLTLRSSLIRVANPGRRIYLEHGTPQERQLLLSAVVIKVQHVLMECLEYPPESDIKDRRRAWLMGTLVDVVGQEFLATRYAWDSWNTFSVKRFLGETPQAYGTNPGLIQPFREALEQHSICEVGSDTRKAYHTFKRLLQDPYRSIESAETSYMMPSTSLVSPTAAIAHTAAPGTGRFYGLDAYLNNCLECQFGVASTDSSQALQGFLQYKPDSRIPFWEKPPSRIHIQSPGSPYDPSTIRMNAGIFSAVVYRGITYNAEFSQHPDAPRIFLNVADWEHKIDTFKKEHIALSKTKNFFCRPDAYGHSINGRSTRNAKIFWSAVEALNWPEKTQRTMSFKACFDLFRNGGFTTMGELCCYLLTCDLHYAGVCDAPTLRDVASFMRTARGGSYRILPSLGFGQVDEHPTQHEVEDALSTIETHLAETFSQEDRSLMGLDLICMEHILCKFKRAVDAEVASSR